jgi:hypothetical protein
MLTTKQLHYLIDGLDALLEESSPSGKGTVEIKALREIVMAECVYIRESQELFEERDQILSGGRLTDEDEETLKTISAKIAAISANRPIEFGGRLPISDLESYNLIQKAARVFDLGNK